MIIVSQFCTDEAVNSLFAYSKKVVDQICNTYDRPRQLKHLQYLIFAGMVSYYGFEHINAISEAFKRNQFVYTRESMCDYLAKQTDMSQDVLNLINKDESFALLFTEFYQECSSKRFYSKGRIIIADDEVYEPDKLLEYTTHEVNHSVNSINMGIVPVGDKFRTRVGVYTRDYNTGVRENKTLEDSINVLQTAEIIDHILAFTQYDIKDAEIKYALDSIRYAAGEKREGLGYEHVVPIIRPLYEDRRFNMLLKDGRISGNVGCIVNEFESKTGVNSFCTLASIFDDMYTPDVSWQELRSNASRASGIVKQYVKH